jgi:hypothetical protein
MSRQLQEIETLLAQLVAEHRKLLGQIGQQQSAMRACRAELIEQSTRSQELTRLKIANLEARRRMLAGQIARAMRLPQEPTVTRLAQLFPQRAAAITKLRNDLRSAIEDVQKHTTLASRLANAVLGHLNAAVRVIAGAVEQAGVYTKSGSPQITQRIGVMEAVG